VRQACAPLPPPSSSATALATGSKKRKFVSCNNNRHNPEAPHDESKCWTLHPELRQPRKSKEATSHTTIAESPANDRVEHFAYVNGTHHDRSNNIILDSGASQHMFNSLCFFGHSFKTDVTIMTGNGQEMSEMKASRTGTVQF
jgi:hypothetical protein